MHKLQSTCGPCKHFRPLKQGQIQPQFGVSHRSPEGDHRACVSEGRKKKGPTLTMDNGLADE